MFLFVFEASHATFDIMKRLPIISSNIFIWGEVISLQRSFILALDFHKKNKNFAYSN